MKQYMTEQDKKAMAKLKKRIYMRNYYRRAKGIPLDAPLHTHPKRKRKAEPAKPKLEAGKRYIRRDGEVSGPLVHTNAPHNLFIDPTHSIDYPVDGRYFSDPSDESRYDLVSEYVEPAAEPAAEPAVEPAKLKLEAGKRYMRRDGAVTEPLTCIPSGLYPFADPFGGARYLPDGRWIDDGLDHPQDLVSEYAEPASDSITSDIGTTNTSTVSSNLYYTLQ